MLNLIEKVEELVQNISPFNGIDIYPAVEMEEWWHPDYIIIKNFEADSFDQPYFDEDAFYEDIKQYLKSFFGVSRINSDSPSAVKDGELVVLFHFYSKELEVYYQGSRRPITIKSKADPSMPKELIKQLEQLDGKAMSLLDIEDIGGDIGGFITDVELGNDGKRYVTGKLKDKSWRLAEFDFVRTSFGEK